MRIGRQKIHWNRGSAGDMRLNRQIHQGFASARKNIGMRGQLVKIQVQ